ncbi:hypothetical protein MUL_1669 [Mycobacterium ulcerans Agy99]|uniref:Uncharacterized protein n=1 Tax=Mycobacterium ulcerans (strain Agy99) TaxID=362242 RepID=A0PP93_MYCUA|nr:hypothetical protein MUL_1669 [Mycobacterium ulcerans Agy99]
MMLAGRHFRGVAGRALVGINTPRSTDPHRDSASRAISSLNDLVGAQAGIEGRVGGLGLAEKQFNGHVKIPNLRCELPKTEWYFSILFQISLWTRIV